MHRMAPAKVNLHLEIIGRREDGYHLLQSIMAPVSLADTISFQRTGKDIIFTCDDPTLPTGDDNLVVRAAKVVTAEIAQPLGVKIHLAKRIPAAAGLGGGSSDAATVLLGLRELFQLPISDDRLHMLAVSLGADVPYFLKGTACLATGIGERLTPYAIGKRWPITLIKPRAGLATPSVYRALAWPLTRQVEPHKLPPALGDLPAICAALHNDLEAPAVSLLPEITECKRHLQEHGAAGVLMTGSGPTVFGIFTQRRQAIAASESAAKRDWWSFTGYLEKSTLREETPWK